MLIVGVSPEVDAGRYPIKRVVDEEVTVEADIVVDGHDVLAARLLHKRGDGAEWREVRMEPLGADRFRGTFRVNETGRHAYTVAAWIDRWETWRRGTLRKAKAGQDVRVERQSGQALLLAAAKKAPSGVRPFLEERAAALVRGDLGHVELEDLLDGELSRVMAEHGPRPFLSVYARELSVVVDRAKARYATWYELFPRSASPEPGRHGRFEDVIARLPYVAGMGFDTLYLPPIHPIGHTHRKGRNNKRVAEPQDVGSPWAIGAEEGGHDAIHPALGTLQDFDRLVAAARQQGIEIALDLALQCSPDHPWVREHPQWFERRADGSIQYAENPPKKYEDIYPINFESDDWEALWREIRRVVLHWVGHGVKMFRVDNPHTKPFRFWEWLIREVKAQDHDVLFLAEAFTRPTMMYELAKCGFTQSYQYFPWKHTKADLTAFFEATTRGPPREFFRSSSWPNTPDILTEHLQYGGRPAFVQRLVLAATLSASYGIYGPPFELCLSQARELGSEEYLDSEKYQLHHWVLDQPHSLAPLITRMNAIRRENPALQADANLIFHPTSNEQMLCYSKRDASGESQVLVVVNLDPHHHHSAWIDLDLEALGLEEERPYQVHDLLAGGRFIWRGGRNFVELNPQISPAHVFRVLRRTRTERDFEYFI